MNSKDLQDVVPGEIDLIEKASMDLRIQSDYEKQTNAPFTDSLTGLFNHGFFQISLDREVKRFQRHGSCFTLALIDIDSFSSYNRRQGHLQGDCMLKRIAGLIMENIRQVDLAARYLGDILAVILINADSQSALVPVERIRGAVEKMSGGDATISVGLASFPRDAANGEGLIQRAQEALSQAKVRRKNKVHFFEEEKRPIQDQRPSILIVDDDLRNLKIMEGLLTSSNHKVLKAADGERALYIVNKVDVDLILLDIMMPGIDGYEVCRRLKGSEATRMIPIVMVTALDDIEAKIRGIECGADDFITKPPNRVELLARIKSLVQAKTLNSNLITMENVLFSLANAVEAKDLYTQGHVQRVANLALAVAKNVGLSAEEIEAVRIGGILHDIGKIGIPEKVLNKQGSLSSSETAIMRRHPEEGYRICLPLKKSLGGALSVIRHHHERLDGSGYPDGLKGEEIATVARVMAVADSYDALVTDRPYREKTPKEEALAVLGQEVTSGKLDSPVVRCLTEMVL